MIDKKQNIRDLSLEELSDIFISYNEKPYRAKQLFDWLHNKMILNIDDVSNIKKELLDRIMKDYDVSMPVIYKEYVSKLDETKKYLILLNDNNIIETVLMKYNYGYSICISTQVGCNMACKFCASTIGGCKRNLDIYELLAQVYLVSRHNDIKISNIVLMGSGEPLLNLNNVNSFMKIINSKFGQNISLRNITLSTCGIVDKIYTLADYKLPITLALSLHAPNDEIRNKIMPISLKYKLKDIMAALNYYYNKTKRRITFEYCLIKDVNDGKENALNLIKLLKYSFDVNNVGYNINLIPINEVVECEFKAPNTYDINLFKGILEDGNLNVTIRRKLGKDISGSCGQLRSSVK